MARDWIPRREQDLVDLMEVWKNGLGDPAIRAAFGWPGQEAMEVVGLIMVFLNARAAYMADKTRVKRIAKDEEKAAAISAKRDFANGYIRFNKKMRDEDKLIYGIGKDNTPTPHPAPVAKPVTEAAPSGKGRHTVTAINPHTNTKKKDGNVTGVAFAHRKREAGEPKANAGAMPSEYQTAATRHFQWDEADYGKVVDYATAYEKAGGGRGPWSDVVSVFIA